MANKPTVIQGVDAARQYATAAKLRALPDYSASTVICQYANGKIAAAGWVANSRRYTIAHSRFTAEFARLLRSQRLIAFTLVIPGDDNGNG